jgi:putative aldouronate transport system substrate-binding protein
MFGKSKNALRILSLLIAALLLFSACGQSADPSGSTGGSTGGSEAAGDPDELVIGFWAQSGVPADYNEVIDAVNEILIRDCNAKIVDSVALNIGNYRDQLTLMLSGNEHLDAFVAHYANFPVYVAKGQVIELDALVEEYGQDIVAAVGEENLNAGKVDGVQYGLTTVRDLATTRGFVFLSNVLDQVGITYDQYDWNKKASYDEIHDMLVKIKEGTDLVPMVPSSAGQKLYDTLADFDPLGDANGVIMNYGQGTEVVNLFAQPEYMEFCKRMRSWYQEGLILQDAVTNQDGYADALKGGRGASYTTNLKPGFDLKTSAQMAQPCKSIPVVDVYTATTIVQTAQWCIARNSVAPEAAMKFLNKMYYDEEVANLLAWGIEGKHYQVIDEENRIIDYPEGVNAENIGYNLNLGWVFGNQFLDYIWNGDSPDLWEQTDKFNKEANRSKAFGYSYDATPVKTEVAAVTNVNNEYRCALEFGAVDPEVAIPEFLAKLEAAGIQKIIDEKQRQLDEYLASKA